MSAEPTASLRAGGVQTSAASLAISLAAWLCRAVCGLAVVLPLSAPAVSADREQPPAKAAVTEFYASRGDTPAWSDDESFDELVAAIQDLSDHGLFPAHYHLQALLEHRGDRDMREPLATNAWFTAAAHMVRGKLDPATYEPDWTARRRKQDLAAHLTKALSDGSVAGSLDALAPRHPEYAALKAELALLRGQPEVTPIVVADGPLLADGAAGERVEQLQARLAQLGLLLGAAQRGVYDGTTEKAIETFQMKSGLVVDGMVGPATLGSLRRDVDSKILQVIVNLERWRWLPDDLGPRHVRVNLADFSVSTFHRGRLERTHSVIIGQPYRKTPVFSSYISYVVLNPWWETPSSLARKDKLPQFKQDPEAADRLGFQILDGSRVVPAASIDWADMSEDNFPYRIRQAPGPLNALGRIKFMFPNKHDVYLHDTPNHGLFSEHQRMFSSGCIRVQDPLDLAEWVFRDTPGWDTGRFEQTITEGTEVRVDLARPVPIHILYFTAEVDGARRYLVDVYDRDGAVLEGLLSEGD